MSRYQLRVLQPADSQFADQLLQHAAAFAGPRAAVTLRSYPSRKTPGHIVVYIDISRKESKS